ncbi:MAG: threonylcarbamoyl-AMP synthase [Clostridiales bacterium]|nr:threonylcarbamoyl-AMP synthase [Clostridiales bacterium]
METLLLNENQTQKAGELLKNGELVAIPTETVYGLGANALDAKAVSNIFKAKGRPQDNPLIVHISEFDEIKPLVREIPETAIKLAEKFWPGPLTMIMKKSELIPDEVSAGLDTVAIRMPSHKIARKIIKQAGIPIAAPSANTSGLPSPTTAQHVMNDMNGKISAVVDGGECEVGVESTVITLVTNPPKLLRPGGITFEQLKSVLGEVEIDKAVTKPLEKNAVVASPGMKYKHYSPKTRVIILKGDFEKYKAYLNSKKGENIAALCFEGEEKELDCKSVTYGVKSDDLTQAHLLFYALRKLDELGVETAYARCPSQEGVGLAVYNRLIRAAAFEIIDLK